MSLRETLNRKPSISIGAAVVLLAVAGFAIYWMNRPLPEPVRATHQWFYDLGSKQLFLVAVNEMPPAAAPSGHTLPDGQPGGVKAYVFSCGSCENEKERFIGIIETYTPEARAALMSFRNPTPGAPGVPQRVMVEAREQGRLVSKPDAVDWLLASSEEGKALINQALVPCESTGKGKECLPTPQKDK